MSKVVAEVLKPYAHKLALNDALFKEGSVQALHTLYRRNGVRYLIVDQINGYSVDLRSLLRMGRVVRRAPGILVLEVRGP